MPFGYYDRLGRREKAIYDQSDAVTGLSLPLAPSLRPVVGVLRVALASDDHAAVQKACSLLARGITEMLRVEAVKVEVLAVRPTLSRAELHGLYTRDDGRPPHIKVWMRTVRHKRVVAFRTFLRTLLHELCHHLDYVHLRLADSYHTQGFFQRESNLFHQLVTDGEKPGPPARMADE
jgi:hypothetical protein